MNDLLGYIVPGYFLILFTIIAIWIFFNRAKKIREIPPVEEERRKFGEKELTIIYNKSNRPSQDLIDSIKQEIPKLQALVLDHIKQTGRYARETKNGIQLEGISFPVFEEEKGVYDFSLDFCIICDESRSLVATFKNGSIQKLLLSA